MKLIKLPMGCLSSRSSVTPSDRVTSNRANNGRPNEQSEGTPVANNHQSNGNLFSDKNTRFNHGNDQYSREQQKNMVNGGGGGGGGGGNSSYTNNDINENRELSLKKKTISRDNSMGSSVETADDDIMSLLMEDKGGTAGSSKIAGHKSKQLKSSSENDGLSPQQQQQLTIDGKDSRDMSSSSIGVGIGVGRRKQHLDTINNSLNGDYDDGSANGVDEDEDGNTSIPSKRNEGSFDEEPNMELLRQYVAVDYEISQLEDKDALRVYHEKIEQLEQLERELDMISSEVEEVVGRSNDGIDLSRAASVTGYGHTNMDSKMDLESNSMISGVSGNTSQRSWVLNNNNNNNNKSNSNNSNNNNNNNINNKTITNNNNNNNNINKTNSNSRGGGKSSNSVTGSQVLRGSSTQPLNGNTNGSANQMTAYSTVEEVFNRKIILEKERDKLKKEVEIVILECDKLQQRYKKRDEILDKLFDGRTGNGLENHLEQQLNWLLEQKHYVDQVFFAWKRAETLTSQTCEQFASALELLKKLPKIEQSDERAELAKSIERLLLKSRQDMEQAQKYNPNVDAPFFTENETERFDKIIKTIQLEQINPNDYSQILTVIQFAYKRAVSIRLWLEQILQTTIARDSFELAEEYKWIAIQLRKERINLIKSRLQNSPYRSMARSVQDQMARQQSISDRKLHQQQQQHEVNRDSGIESEPNDLDIEEEIFRVLEMNKSRLDSTLTGTGTGIGAGTRTVQTSDHLNNPASSKNNESMMNLNQHQQLRVAQQNGAGLSSSASGSGSESNQRDQMMQERVQKRVKGTQQLHLDQVEPPMLPSTASTRSGTTTTTLRSKNDDSTTNLLGEDSGNGSRLRSGASPTPTKLKVELDEEARQSLLKQVDQIHVRHKDQMERLRGNNRAKATEFIMSKMQKVRQSASTVAEEQRQ